MVTCSLILALAALGLCLNLVGAAVGPIGGAAQGGANRSGDVVSALSGVVGAIFALVWYGIVLMGAIQMYRMQTWGLALAGSIMALFPCSICCILALPFGIWSLVVLCNADVKEAFR
jgi:hypothetical protein